MWIVSAQRGSIRRVIERFETENETILFCEDRNWQYYFAVYNLTARLTIRFDDRKENL